MRLTETHPGLLQAIGSGEIPSIPRSIRVLLLGQTDAEDAYGQKQDASSAETVLQHVITSNRKRERLLRESEQLSRVLNQEDDDVRAIARVFREISHARLVDDVDEAKQIAIRRSGARGAKARRVANELEADLLQSTKR